MPNPFRHMGEWYWKDEEGLIHGPYRDERKALRELLKHDAPPMNFFQKIARFFSNDTRRTS